MHERVSVHLCEVDVLRGGEVEALLAAFVPQQTLREPVRHFHVAAVEPLRVLRGVRQHGRRLLDVSGVEERGVTEKPFRLEGENNNYINTRFIAREGIPKTSISERRDDIYTVNACRAEEVKAAHTLGSINNNFIVTHALDISANTGSSNGGSRP